MARYINCTNTHAAGIRQVASWHSMPWKIWRSGFFCLIFQKMYAAVILQVLDDRICCPACFFLNVILIMLFESDYTPALLFNSPFSPLIASEKKKSGRRQISGIIRVLWVNIIFHFALKLVGFKIAVDNFFEVLNYVLILNPCWGGSVYLKTVSGWHS